MTLRFKVVYGGSSEKDVIRRLGHTVVNNIEEANALWLTGGADIPPSLYGQVNVASGRGSAHDDADYEATNYWSHNKEKFKILVGACRGAQWLNCISGGNMWQDVNNHYGHHKTKDLRTGKVVTTNSIHHQLMRPSADAEILAVCDQKRITRLVDDTGTYLREELPTLQEIEALWYPNTKSLCFQGHPEYGHEETTQYFMELFREKYSQVA